jgi:fructokinase
MASSERAVKRVVGVGEVLWDCFPSGDRLGGAPLNFTAHCQQLGSRYGIQAFMLSRVGNDPLGMQAIQQIEQLGVDTTYLQVDSAHRTGIVRVELNHGEPSYEIVNDVAWDYLHWNERLSDLAKSADVVCFGSLAQRHANSREVIQRFLKETTASIRLFDINLRAPFVSSKIVLECMAHVNYVKLNEEELGWLADELGVPRRDEIELTALAVRHELALDALLLTRGALGCFYVTSTDVIGAEVPTIEFAADANAVGAGDAATAAFVVGLLRGSPIAEIVAHANRVGAFVASQPGAVPHLPESLL